MKNNSLQTNKNFEFILDVGCPLMCRFCPQTTMLNNYKSNIKSMNFNSFKQVLSKIPNDFNIHFSGRSEPFINKYLVDMIQYTLENNFKIKIFSTFQFTSLINIKKLFSILEKYKNQIIKIVAHLPDIGMNMQKFNIDNLCEYYKIINFINNYDFVSFMTMDIQNQTLVDFGIPLNKFAIWKPDNRVGLVFDSEKIFFKNINCRRSDTYESFAILPNLDILMCSADWRCEYIISNMAEISTYDDILKNNKYLSFISHNKYGSMQKYTRCASCIYAYEK